MPTLSEFQLTIGRRREEASGITYTLFRIDTVRQFSAFKYMVEVDADLNHDSRTLALTLKGVQTPTGLMSSAGTGSTELVYPELIGEYDVVVMGAKQEGRFRFSANEDGITLLDVDEETTISVDVDNTMQVVRA